MLPAAGEARPLTRRRRRIQQDCSASSNAKSHGRPGWISGQLLNPVDLSDTRVIVGTWRSREDWEAWHDDPAFLANRNALDRLQVEPNVTAWYQVVDDARVGGE